MFLRLCSLASTHHLTLASLFAVLYLRRSTIPAGEDSVTVLVDPVDDPEVDGDQIAPITATAPGYGPTTQDVLVEDDDVPGLPKLTIEPGPNTPLDANGNPVLIENGEPGEVVITREGPFDQPAIVFLDTDDDSEATVPTFVVFAPGEETVTALVTPVDDPDVDGTQFPTITATSDGYEPDTLDVTVLDDDVVGDAVLEGRVFNDVDGDNTQDGLTGPDLGIEGVEIFLVQPDGTIVDQVTTDSNGVYRFTVPAGQYQVLAPPMFGAGELVDANVGDDARDSDADPMSGLTEVFTLVPGNNALDIDVGYADNLGGNMAPDALDDTAMTCVDEVVSVQVLANDSDPENDPFFITAVDGQTIDPFFGPEVFTSAGTKVTYVEDFLTGEVSLQVDGSSAYGDLDIGETVVEGISYTVQDINGNSATAVMEVTFMGTAKSVDSLFNELPSAGTYEVTYAADQFDRATNLAPDFAYDITFLNTGDARFDGVTFEKAYCLDFGPVLKHGPRSLTFVRV